MIAKKAALKLPSHKQALALLNKFHVPSNIMEHSLLVNKVAMKIAKDLAKKIDVNIKLVDRASLLHDLFKYIEFNADELDVFCRKIKEKYKGMSHEEAAYRFFLYDYPELAKVILNHGYKSIDKLNSIEEKIVYYADKRVMHNKIVSLTERLAEGHRRHAQKTKSFDYDSTKKIDSKIFALEKELFTYLNYNPSLLNKL